MADGYENHAPENLQVSIQKTQNLSLCFDQILVQLFVYVCIKKQGKYQAMVVCCILGIGSLFSWNSMLTIADYYYQVFPVRFRFWFEFQFCNLCFMQDYHPSRVFTLIYQPIALGTIMILAYRESKISTRKRILTGYILFTISTFLLIVVSISLSLTLRINLSYGTAWIFIMDSRL